MYPVSHSDGAVKAAADVDNRADKGAAKPDTDSSKCHSGLRLHRRRQVSTCAVYVHAHKEPGAVQ